MRLLHVVLCKTSIKKIGHRKWTHVKTEWCIIISKVYKLILKMPQ